MNMTIKELQEIELNMLKILHTFMSEHNLQYYLIGGTMLGVVRHKGFIPWDDDVDIGMPREDYDRFISIANLLPESLKLKSFKTSRSHIYAFVKVENINTYVTEVDLEHLKIKRGIAIDVFPLDGTPNNRIIRKMHLIKMNFLLYILRLRRININKKRNLIKQAIALMVIKIFSYQRLITQIDTLMKKYDYANSEIIANYAGNHREKEMMLKSIIGKPTPCVFEECSFWGIENTDEYLKHVYGDYMKLPPKSKRECHLIDYGWLER